MRQMLERSDMTTQVDRRATAATRARYDRLARFYDLMQRGAEWRYAPWRARLWNRARGPRVLEVGVGTGENMPFYRPSMAVTAIDLSAGMLERAQKRAARRGMGVVLRQADVQALPLPDASFDTAVATFVFCSVPDPLLGLRELRRVLVPGGQLLLLEHVLSHRPILRPLMQLINPLAVRLMGANVDRETVEQVRRAEYTSLKVDALWLDIFKLIEAES